MTQEKTANPRRIKPKAVQIHWECVCGRNIVDTEYLPIRWKDFYQARIMRKIDKSTGKPFLFQKQDCKECHCYDEDN